MAEDFEVNGPLPEESNNRTFVMAAAGLGALLVVSMICLALYALVLAPRQREGRIARATEIVLENTRIAQELTQTAQAGEATATPPPVTPTASATPTPTQVVVLPTDTPTSTSTPFTTLPTLAPLTATAAAQQTEAAAATPTATATALPDTGFAEDIGLPGLFLMGALLLVVVFVTRRLRTGSAVG